MKRFVLLALLSMALLLAGVSCGGGAGILQPEGAKDTQGISEGGFNLVRYDDSGNATNALNPTLDLSVQQAADTTTVRIAIDDAQPMLGATCDLRYDASKYTPVDVEFSGLIDTEIELSSTRNRGLVAVGQVSTDGAAVHSGQFAVVTFRNEPCRTVSASGDAAEKSIDSQYAANGFSADGFTVAGDGGGGLILDILGIFTSLSGDGDQNGASNIADLTPLGSFLGHAVSATDAISARSDYDGNGLPNISDLTALGGSLGEVTTGIEILAGDADPPGTVVATLDWTAGNAPEPPGTLTDDPFDVWRHWAATVDAAGMNGVDANADGHVFVSARAITSNPTGNPGPLFSPAVDVQVGTVITSNFIVTAVNLQVGGTTISDGATLDLMHANDHITIEATSFTGTYNGTAFTGADVGTTVPQAEYDTELALIQEDVQILDQELNPTGVADFESDKEDVILDFTHHGNGQAPAQPATATIFPDDDPGNAAEGSVKFGFARSNNTVADMTVTIDVQEDFNTIVIDSINTTGLQDGNGNWIVSNLNPDIKGHLDFQGVPPGTLDDTTIDVELVDLTNNARVPIDFDFVPAQPTAGGTFNVTPSAVPPGYDFSVRVPAGTLSSTYEYMIRFYTPAGEHGSSVNKPGDFLTGGTISTNFDSEVLPRHNVNSDENVIAIVPADPMILRNPQQDTNVPNGTVEFSYDGSGDLLKASGDSFSIEFSGGQPYPQVVVKVSDDPGDILPTDTPAQGIPVSVPETNPHRIVLDISGFTETETTTYAYKVFGAPAFGTDPSTRPVITEGTFTQKASGEDEFVANIAGVNFGVNVYDGAGSGDLALGNEDWSDKFISASSLPLNYGDGGNDVDVLFVQFNGGHVEPLSVVADPDDSFTSSSVKVKLTDLGGSGSFVDKTLDVRIAGIGTGDLDYIGIAHLTFNEDVGANKLVPGLEYEVSLHDGFGGIPFSFGTGAADPRIIVVI